MVNFAASPRKSSPRRAAASANYATPSSNTNGSAITPGGQHGAEILSAINSTFGASDDAINESAASFQSSNPRLQPDPPAGE